MKLKEQLEKQVANFSLKTYDNIDTRYINLLVIEIPQDLFLIFECNNHTLLLGIIFTCMCI